MASKSKRVRGFYQSSRSWHWPASRLGDESENFSIGIYHVEPDDGCEYEFSIKLARLTDREDAWSLKVFGDSWRALVDFADFFALLATLGEGQTTADRLRAVLTACGVVDLTKENRPGSGLVAVGGGR